VCRGKFPIEAARVPNSRSLDANWDIRSRVPDPDVRSRIPDPDVRSRSLDANWDIGSRVPDPDVGSRISQTSLSNTERRRKAKTWKREI